MDKQGERIKRDFDDESTRDAMRLVVKEVLPPRVGSQGRGGLPTSLIRCRQRCLILASTAHTDDRHHGGLLLRRGKCQPSPTQRLRAPRGRTAVRLPRGVYLAFVVSACAPAHRVITTGESCRLSLKAG